MANFTYVVFDGDNDGWAYQYIRGWAVNRRLGFDFSNSHDLDAMTSRAQDEHYVKRNLRARMQNSDQVLVLVGEKTKNLYRYVRWEIEMAIDLGLPIIVVNLNKKRNVDHEKMPPILRDVCALHIGYRFRAIKEALSTWKSTLRGLSLATRAEGPRVFTAKAYTDLGLGASEG
ncbi:TIR domain-containing protein [Rhizobium leguminosarum]|uniref:TIR domain-containing protein n=1 Tax=Rhizobium leguminosarum TaxID=384 RepID=UPI001A90F2BF|nr:TIR domain-containing protein [Rhizobium leguminosarum]MBY5553003.1 TIR domain-containing protein [Rhizobium leguminosarum]QSW21911.1 TIR domain-containing protein [Rhizobium leguminosarum]